MPLSRSEQARLNGAKSRGPRTPEGKAVSSMNALRHGRRANRAPAPPHGPEFEKLLDSLSAQFAPSSAAEAALVHQIAAADWQQARWRAIETAVMNRIYNRSCPAGNDEDSYATLAAALEASFKGPRLLNFIYRRQSAYRVAQDRALRALCLHRQSSVLAAPIPGTGRQNVAEDDIFAIAKTPQFQVQATDDKPLTRQAPETSEPERTCDAYPSSYPQSQSSPSTSPNQPLYPIAARSNFFELSEMPENASQPADSKPLIHPGPQTSEPNSNQPVPRLGPLNPGCRDAIGDRFEPPGIA
jgi:hypothetical protein